MHKVFFSFFILLLLSGCYKAALSNGDAVIYDEKDHKLQSKKLKQVMYSLDLSIANNYANELEREDTKVRYALRLSEDVKGVVTRLREMGEEELDKRLTKEDREIFHQSLAELENCGRKIEEVALQYEVEKIDVKIKKLQHSCKACHARFGVSYGQ